MRCITPSLLRWISPSTSISRAAITALAAPAHAEDGGAIELFHRNHPSKSCTDGWGNAHRFKPWPPGSRSSRLLQDPVGHGRPFEPRRSAVGVPAGEPDRAVGCLDDRGQTQLTQPRQEYVDRHIADEMQPNALHQTRTQLFRNILLGPAR